MPLPSNPGMGGPASPGGNGASGPGALSRRTDQGPAQKLATLPDAQYGENATYQQDQQGASLAQTPSPSGGGQDLPTNPAADAVVPFSAPTQRPNEPVTHGAALGAGAGPEAMGLLPQQAEQKDMTDLATKMPLLEAIGNLDSAHEGTRLMVNLIRANT
jgi:hypothetical protein